VLLHPGAAVHNHPFCPAEDALPSMWSQ